jgi:hypothetical protein
MADGAGDNTPTLEGKISPAKLDKKKFKPAQLLSGVATTGPVTGLQQNPEKEYLSYPKNLKFDSTNAPFCTAAIEFLPTASAEAACPSGSKVGSGTAQVMLPGGFVSQPITVTAFNGPQKNQIRLHTYSEELAGATPTVFGEIVKSKVPGYGQALSVPDAPDVGDDAGMITLFNATISKSSKIVLARCKSKTMKFQREVTYDDGSTETAELTQKCKQKKKKK